MMFESIFVLTVTSQMAWLTVIGLCSGMPYHVSVISWMMGKRAYDLPDDVVAASLPCKAKHPPFEIRLQLSYRCEALLRHEGLDLWAALQQSIWLSAHACLWSLQQCSPLKCKAVYA